MASLAAQNNLVIRQFDIASAYLNGDFEEEITMEAPKFFEEFLKNVIDLERNSEIENKAKNMLHDFKKGNKVCLLKKFIYGLRQAGRTWYNKLDKVLRQIGVTPSKSDPCLFQSGAGEDIIMVAVYVDDIVVASRDEKAIDELKRKLSADFEVKDLGHASYCLGVEFKQSDGEVSIHCDHRSYLPLAENPTFHARSKHIDIRHHFIRDVLSSYLRTYSQSNTIQVKIKSLIF